MVENIRTDRPSASALRQAAGDFDSFRGDAWGGTRQRWKSMVLLIALAIGIFIALVLIAFL